MEQQNSRHLNSDRSRPLIDLKVLEKLETATFALGCFWGPEARFGALEGVVRTRVGYAGGTTQAPSYRQIGDHLETLQLEFDPQVIGFEQLLKLFFEQYNPFRAPYKRQYASALFYHNPEQQSLIEQKIAHLEQQEGKPVAMEVQPYGEFFLAEERHQKYKLQRHPALLAEYQRMYPQLQVFINSTAVTRVNGYLGGNVSLEEVLLQVGVLGLSKQGQEQLLQAVAAITGSSFPRVE
jgi:peptide-methionine (S)-S-oxide reductase